MKIVEPWFNNLWAWPWLKRALNVRIMGKKKTGSSPLVYSTDPTFRVEEERSPEETLPPNQQWLKISLETKHRAGKIVTLVTGFVGAEDDLATLGKQLKNHCGTGGSAKDGEIILQGDHRDKARAWLVKNAFGLR
jgi:translation initiation factor 1